MIFSTEIGVLIYLHPRGNKFNEFIRTPMAPVTAKGCNGIKVDVGSATASVSGPRMVLTIPETKVLCWINSAERAGKKSYAPVFAPPSIDTVIARPVHNATNEKSNPTNGPDKAKSNKDDLFNGEDFNLVTAPRFPVTVNGRIDGTDISGSPYRMVIRTYS